MNQSKEGHPHAELMLQYAIDAKTNPEPFHEWEFCSSTSNGFVKCTDHPSWHISTKYRNRKDSLIEESKKTLKEHGLELNIWCWVGVDDDGTAYAFRSKPTYDDGCFYVEDDENGCSAIQLPIMMGDHKHKLVNVITGEETFHETTN
jgi:hypothetical protein